MRWRQLCLGYFFLYRSRTGYELRLTGQNELFARYSGVSIVKVVLVSQLLGGFIAGVGGGVELLSPDLFTVFVDFAAWLWLGCNHYLHTGKE
ncbi:MAG: ABC transporter permease subunit [Lachnospiraceae bacterium]